MKKPQEFWIYQGKNSFDKFVSVHKAPLSEKQSAPHNFDEIHVIDYESYAELKRENAILIDKASQFESTLSATIKYKDLLQEKLDIAIQCIQWYEAHVGWEYAEEALNEIKQLDKT